MIILKRLFFWLQFLAQFLPEIPAQDRVFHILSRRMMMAAKCDKSPAKRNRFMVGPTRQTLDDFFFLYSFMATSSATLLSFLLSFRLSFFLSFFLSFLLAESVTVVSQPPVPRDDIYYNTGRPNSNRL